MAKKFGDMNPLDKLSGTKKPVADTDTKVAATDPVATAAEPKTKRKVGRPKTKTEETKTINIAVPVSVLAKLDIVKVCYGSNLTQYINKLIEKDIDANFDTYKMLAENLNSFNN